MTSTSFNTGYSLSRNSSKVIQPPGGQTADIFGSRAEAGYSSASSQAGSDVASSRVHIETDQQSIGGHSASSHGLPVDGIAKQSSGQTLNGQVSPNGSVNSSAGQQPLLLADDFKPVTAPDQQQQQQPNPYQQQQLQQQPVNPQQQKLINAQQAAAEVNRSPKKTIPVIRRNPITGEIYDNPSDRQQAVVRVRQPPGGRSSGIF